MEPLGVVLDTNVWIDWLLFADPATATLRAAQRCARIRIFCDTACGEEFERVLGYPEFSLDAAERQRLRAQLGRCSVQHAGGTRAGATALPRCSDPDDQKFLALAFETQARWLLTRDKALLRMARRLRATGLRVGSPLDFSLAFDSRA